MFYCLIGDHKNYKRKKEIDLFLISIERIIFYIECKILDLQNFSKVIPRDTIEFQIMLYPETKVINEASFQSY